VSKTDFFARMGANAPAYGSASPTLSNTATYPNGEVARGLEVLAAGTVAFTGADGVDDSRTITDAMLPYVLPVCTIRVKATGTTIAPAAIKCLW